MHLLLFFPTEAQIPGLFLPLSVCLYLGYKRLAVGFGLFMCLVFIATTATDVYFAHWTIAPNYIELRGYPVCALTLIFMGLIPNVPRPSAALGFNMVFFSLLTRDVLCGTHYALINNLPHFLAGIGGYGFKDALLIEPLTTALGLIVLKQVPVFERFLFQRSALKLQ